MPKRKLDGVGEGALRNLLGDPTLSLASIHRSLKKLDLPISMHSVERAYHEQVTPLMVSEEIQGTDGNPVTIRYCDPGRLLQYCVEVSPALQDWYAEAANTHRGVWSVAVLFDEYVPGDKLKANNFKKAMTLGFNFLELGQSRFYLSSTWMVPMALRSAKINQVPGGWSHILCRYLRRQFLCANAMNTSGIPLNLNGQWFMLQARLTHLASDGDGLRSGLCLRGANGIRPCFKHTNVVKKQSNLAHRGVGLVEISCHDPSLFQPLTEQELDDSLALVQAAHARHAAGSLTLDMYTKISQSRGMHYVENGIWWDLEVRNMLKVSVVTIDWVHTFLSDGVFGTEAFAFLNASQHIAGKGFRDFHGFLKLNWQFPRQRRSQMKNLHLTFNTFREDYAAAHEKLKGNASEFLCVYGMLRHWVSTEIAEHEDLETHRESLQACCDCMDIIQVTKQGGMTLRQGGRKLNAAAGRHMSLHKSVYGDSLIKPKHHWMFDIAQQWLDQQPGIPEIVVDAFSIEKLHLRVKPVADRTDNTSNFETTLLAGMLHYQTELLKGLHGSAGQLLGKSAACLPGFPAAQFSSTMVVNSMEFTLGDIVVSGRDAGSILACVCEHGDFFVWVEQLVLLESISSHSGKYAADGSRVAWAADGMLRQASHMWNNMEAFLSKCTNAKRACKRNIADMSSVQCSCMGQERIRYMCTWLKMI